MKKNIFMICALAAMVGCESTDGTPGDGNPKDAGGVKINETYSRGTGSGAGTDDDDWVELYNSSAEPVDVSGWVLSDKQDMSEKVTLDAGTIIPAKGFLAVTVDRVGGFGLSSDGDAVYLYDNTAKAVDFVEFGDMEETESWAAYPDGSKSFRYQTITKGASNNTGEPSGHEPDPTIPNAGNIAGLVINEVDGNGKFVELYNKSTAAINLEGVTLIKNEETAYAKIWWIGGDVSVAAGDYYTICEDGGDLAGDVDEATGNGGISPKKNIKFELFGAGDDPEDTFVRSSSVDLDASVSPDYGAVGPYSFARCPDGTGAFGLATPSADAANPASSAGTIQTAE